MRPKDQDGRDAIDVLNLNAPPLSSNRLAVIKRLRVHLQGLEKRNKWKRATLEAELARFANAKIGGQLPEYCEVARQYLQRKLRAIEA